MRVCLLLVLALASAGARTAPELRPCWIGAADAAQRLQARCMDITVPEDYGHPARRQIGLHVAVLRARSRTARPDALFFLAGGPGQAATEAYLEEAGAFERLRGERDIVLVDQRGTGESNRLDCPTPADADAAALTAAAVRCLKHLPGDPRLYTTSVAVEDLDAVRAALGYSQIDLYGISYGTRVALQYLRSHPQRVRTMTLDGVVPADLALGPGVSLDAQHALELIFQRCRQDADCHRAFPDPAADLKTLQRNLELRPARVALRDPLDGTPLEETLSWDKTADAVQLMSYQSETAALLPLLLHRAAAGDAAPLLGTALIFGRTLDQGLASGMANSVLCTEDAPYLATGAERSALQDTYLGTRTLDSFLEVCRVWPRGVLAADFKQPVESAVPALLISGADDPITPPANAARAARTLPNSLSLVVPGQGHGNVFRGCLPRILTDFVARASVRGLDTRCVAAIKPFPFFLNFSGPAP